MNKPSIDKILPIKSGLNKLSKIFKITSVEKELEQSKSYLSIALNGTEHGDWNWNMETDEMEFSPDAQAILGYEEKVKKLNKDSFMGLIHPNDRTSLLDGIDKHKLGVTEYVNVDIRMKSAYGNWNWISLRGKIVEFDDSGVPLRFTGINYDVNEQKQYDDDVQELQQRVFQSQEDENNGKKNTDLSNKDIDNYSKFRLNGLRNILNYN